jgi:hypothetical protein
MNIGSCIKYLLFLSDFNETWNFLSDFREIIKQQIFMEIHPVGAESSHADGQTDRRNKRHALFSQFCRHTYKQCSELQRAFPSACSPLNELTEYDGFVAKDRKVMHTLYRHPAQRQWIAVRQWITQDQLSECNRVTANVICTTIIRGRPMLRDGSLC